MRTSGAATESRMTLTVLLVASFIAMMIAGGPSAVLTGMESGLRAVASALQDAWVSFNR